jgi:hypothetical protein
MRTDAQRVLLLYAALVTCWQVVGVALLAAGQSAPGPSASISGAVLAGGIGLGFALTDRRFPRLFLMLALFAGASAAQALYHAWTGDPSLWPSPFTRAGGAAINALGVVGAGLAVRYFFRRRN